MKESYRQSFSRRQDIITRYDIPCRGSNTSFLACNHLEYVETLDVSMQKFRIPFFVWVFLGLCSVFGLQAIGA